MRKAIVMAGGQGSRLRPLTLTRPKPMVPVANRPVMAHILNWLRGHGFTDVLVTLHYLTTVYLARQPQHVTVLGIVDTVVAIGQTAAERRHGQRSAAQFGDQLNERLFVHNATRQLLSARPKPVVAPAPSIMDWP